MTIAQILDTYRRGRSVSYGPAGPVIGTIDGSALIIERAYSRPSRARLVLLVNVREMKDGRYTGRTFKSSSDVLSVKR